MILQGRREDHKAPQEYKSMELTKKIKGYVPPQVTVMAIDTESSFLETSPMSAHNCMGDEDVELAKREGGTGGSDAGNSSLWDDDWQ